MCILSREVSTASLPPPLFCKTKAQGASAPYQTARGGLEWLSPSPRRCFPSPTAYLEGIGMLLCFPLFLLIDPPSWFAFFLKYRGRLPPP